AVLDLDIDSARGLGLIARLHDSWPRRALAAAPRRQRHRMPESHDVVASESASPPDTASSRLRLAGCLAVAMACLGVIADLLLQYTNNQAHLHDVPAVLADVPVWRLYAGTLLGVWVCARAGVGGWPASVGLAASPRLARAFLVTGLLAYAWGAAFHGTFLFAGLLAHAAEIGSPVAHAAALRDA